MVKLRNIRPKDPPLTLAEAKEILAKAVLKIEDDESFSCNIDYQKSVNSIKNVATEFLRQHSGVNKKRSRDKERPAKKPKTPSKEIIIPSQEKSGPCPCENCKNNSHIPGLDVRHKCPFCIKSYYKTSHLRSHVHVHSSDRDHVCSECGDAFKRHDQLVRHLYTHDTSKQRFKCKTCAATFTRKDNFKTHIKRKQGCRDALGNKDVYSGLEEVVLQSVIKKPEKKKKDLETIKSEPTAEDQLKGDDAMLVPVRQNEDGTLTVSGEIINVPKEEVAGILTKSRDTVTPETDIILQSREMDVIETPTEDTVELRSCSAESEEVSAISSVKKTNISGSRDLYNVAKTPPDIINLNINLPITDQIAQLSTMTSQSVFVESENIYQNDLGATSIALSRDDNAGDFGSEGSGISQSIEMNPEQQTRNTVISAQFQQQQNSQQASTMNPTILIVQNLPELCQLNGSCLQSSATQVDVHDVRASDPFTDSPDTAAKLEQGDNMTREEEEQTDILSRVIADILTDNLPDTEEGADEQIINVMQGEVTVTSTPSRSDTPPPTTRCAMELLEAVLLMGRAVSDTTQNEGVNQISVAENCNVGAVIENCNVGAVIENYYTDQLIRDSVLENNQLPVEEQTDFTDVKNNNSKILQSAEENTSDNLNLKPETPTKTPEIKLAKSKKKRAVTSTNSPKRKVLKIKNSLKPKDSLFVKNIFNARKRLFTENDEDSKSTCKTLKLEEPTLTVGALNVTMVEQSHLLLQRNELLLAQAMGDLTASNTSTEAEEARSVGEDSKPSPASAEECERDIFLSPYRDTLFSDSPVRNTMLSSPLTNSPLIQEDSPKFMFLASSPARSNTPDRHSIRSGTPEPSFFHRCITPDRSSLFNHGRPEDESSPLFHRSPDNGILRSLTPERGILQTPDHSKLGTLSFGHDTEEPAFDDNFICNLDQLLAFK